MIEEYLEKLVFKVRDLNEKYDKVNKKEMSNVNLSNNLQVLNNQIALLRRDVNDLHTMMLLRSASSRLVKKNRLVFLGTGQINENVLHAYLHFQRLLKQGDIQFQGEVLFVARTKIEYELVKNFGYPCELWQYQAPLAYYLLETKVVVLSSHIWSEWGNCLLSHCIASAIKIQLWHGLPAKTIGASVIDSNMNFHHFASLLEDSAAVNHICMQNDNIDVVSEYKRAFPLAKYHVTGDCRLDILFNDEFQKLFLSHKSSHKLEEWLHNNRNRKKVIYSPTFRENQDSRIIHYQKILELISEFSKSNIQLAIKLHVACGFSAEQRNHIVTNCNSNGFILIEDLDEVYSSFNSFDAMITDYSSIRIDYVLTGKPVFLWRFDKNSYNRTIDVVSLFSELDSILYNLSESNIAKYIEYVLEKDPKGNDRAKFINEKLKLSLDGLAAERTIRVILDVINNDM
ncbi:CDP-glycerol glycerophosphotransferase family protein [Actinobacillus equuli]|uniref:CDP-glycerol glycerophosphotransferase family protein n=1 Tax=Actinobacillus equuli TaxID=718 RepID=UPI0024412C60|nr:CDP-glycerol glycerophosphotransferase family protein [Actinobacillus equuli]WGE42146.1 CDP-glycerol glycerophosphotransferase family protein [Actinobacillus equuli subsp. haemolyticus]WGE50683.1 CDP-glycerol glycerophosphotransferase family protein [Actinobacillus equuli subsp. haemolyticus]WGE52853.1 CDP-glycerol glycerophosphotransferase family protein [Actinobacillus equuli subsp. haemolyticus]WGE73297.1 CDP-glycerol glycerophosphotransferase family protein [Actinobacillus equuli subsp. 